MKLKRPHLPKVPLSVLMALLVVLGAAAVVAGVYLLLGLAPALIIGGGGMATVGLLVDV